MNHKVARNGQLMFATALALFVGLGSGADGGEPSRIRKPGNVLDGASTAQPSDTGRRLDSLLVEVNGERRIVRHQDGIDLVVGDLLTIVDAYLVDRAHPVKRVDLVGYRSRLNDTSGDDRGRVIDTGRNLSKKRSLGGDGRQYRIDVSTAEGLSGFTLLNLQEPELLSFEVEINGKVLKLVANEPLVLRPDDTIRVIDVRTNVRGNENVKYDRIASGTAKEIRFSRGERVFARIPIEWQGR